MQTHTMKCTNNMLYPIHIHMHLRNLMIQVYYYRMNCKFTVQIYQDSALEQKKGRAVILYTKKEDDNILVCCNEKNEICPVKMELPKEINESQHKAVFYLTELSASQVCTFESSLCRGQFLGFEDDKDKHSLKKLVLHPRDCDQVDDASEIIMNS
uniref:Interleukin-18 n=1 Tax=Anabas testudineus TaxID=64144 RepID=A0A7N6AGM6_ANATE